MKRLAIAIVGGSGSGKSWMADRLQQALGRKATRLSEDDFYHDRSHLSPARRVRLNFDHPRAIDWPLFEAALGALLSGKPAQVPCYDFATHCRLGTPKLLRSGGIIIVDGLWLLRRRSLRALFAKTIFLQCPASLRLRRRLERDRRSRGRSESSVRRQFRITVEPMHRVYVEPQAGRADLVLQDGWGEPEVVRLAREILEQAQ